MSGKGVSVFSIDHDPILFKSSPRQGGLSHAWRGLLAVWLCLLIAGCVTPIPQTRNMEPSPTPSWVSTARPSPTHPLAPPTAMPTARTTPPPRGAAYPARPAGLSRGQVVRVVDGDTVDVNVEGGQERVRLIGLDAPETHSPREPVQCFGAESTHRAEELLNDQAVFVELDPTQGVRDRYGRLLGYLWLTDRRLVNLEMIAEGYAFEYTYDRPYKYQAAFQQAEQDAQVRQAGLWSPQTCNGELLPATPGP